MSFKARFVNPQEHYRRIKPEIDAAINDVLTNGDLVMRQQLKSFEENLAKFVGTQYAVGVNSGYHALHLSLLAVGVGPGDEVITVGHTFVASVSAIVHVGAKPVLVDVTKDYNMDIELFEKAITPKTKAVMPVHLNGRICDMGRVMEIAKAHNLIVVEDAAQALGATYKGQKAGSFGTTGCFSFYPFKILGGFGDGGAVTTNDPEIAKKVTYLRYNGEDRNTGEYHYHGYTALLDNIQAAVLDVKLKHLPSWIEQRRKIAGLYLQALSRVEEISLPHYSGEDYHDIFQNYVIRTKKRDELRKFLTENGVETLVHWQKPMWRHTGLKIEDPGLPETEAICREVISLPMSAETTPADVEITASTIKQFFAKVPAHAA